MNILEIDCVSFSTRVAYAAATELFELLQADEQNEARFVPVKVPEELEEQVIAMGDYVCKKGCDSGERLFRWLQGSSKLYDVDWQDAPQELVLTLQTFVSVCSSTFTKLQCLQIAAEHANLKPAAATPPDIEDTIFEPVGSLGEMLPHAVDALNRSAEIARAKAPEAEAQNQASKNDRAQGAALSAGETVHSSAAEKTELPPAPKTPAERKTADKKPKAAK